MANEDKQLLDLIARYTFLTQCKDTELLDLGTYSKILWHELSENEMEKIKYYMQRLDEHHNETREFLDNCIEKG